MNRLVSFVERVDLNPTRLVSGQPILFGFVLLRPVLAPMNGPREFGIAIVDILAVVVAILVLGFGIYKIVTDSVLMGTLVIFGLVLAGGFLVAGGYSIYGENSLGNAVFDAMERFVRNNL